MYNKEGRSLVAKLAAAFGINLLIIVPALLYLLSFGVNLGSGLWKDFISWLLVSFLIIDISLVFFFACYLLYSVLHQFRPFRKKPDYIIVLGSGIRSEEVPPLLKSRLDKGLQVFHQSPQAKFIVSGGQGYDEPVSEAFAMAKYLRSQGVPNEQIILEDQSTTTYLNMAYSKHKIKEDWSEPTKTPLVVFTTNNYHVLRASIYAQKAHLKAHGLGAPTAYYFLPTALLREFVAILVENKLVVGCILAAILSFVGLSYLPFNLF